MKKVREIAEVMEVGEKEPPMRMRTLQPPHPGASITVEEAMQALDRVRAAEKARRASRRKRARSAAVTAGPDDHESVERGKGDEGS